MLNNELLTITNNNICEKERKETEHIQPWEAYGNILDLEKKYSHSWEAYENRKYTPIKFHE